MRNLIHNNAIDSKKASLRQINASIKWYEEKIAKYSADPLYAQAAATLGVRFGTNLAKLQAERSNRIGKNRNHGKRKSGKD